MAADQIVSGFEWVDYFPSYEIITGSHAGGLYYEDDYREVNSRGVAHAMRCFVKNYASRSTGRSQPERPEPQASWEPVNRDIVCDEEAIDSIRA
ncbi:GSCFA domain-containing protein [Rhizobium binxianense]